MKLTKKHVGSLFNVEGSDGSWVYQLVAVSRTHLLFYDFHGTYVKERKGEHKDWLQFEPTNPWPESWVKYGWLGAKED